LELKNKNVLILSQQDWGAMFISKHHYAVELAKAGNTVYYMNGPEQAGKMRRGEIEITKTDYQNLFLIKHRLPFPYILKFKARWLYDYLLTFHIVNVLRKIPKQVDLVWSFDLSDTVPLRIFPKSIKKIYMPVDELRDSVAINAAKGANLVASVTNEILSKFDSLSTPKLFLNHGVADYFINTNITDTINNPVQVGLSGNFLRTDIDHETLKQIINAHPSVVFNFWGLIDFHQSNLLAPSDSNTLAFIEELKVLPNVRLYGQVPPETLAAQLKKMDCFLICYDINKDYSKGTNYHKVLEYLAVGKVVVSNNITTYNNYPGLIAMPEERNNMALPELFNKVITRLGEYNNVAKQQERVAFALAYTYSNQLKKIERYLN
jgi:glycosyltransferase involved in cell wall biosynthesis